MAAANSSNRGAKPAQQKAAPRRKSRSATATSSPSASARTSGSSAPLASLAEQLASRILKPLGLVVLSRERIAETLEEAAERGRLTRHDAEELAAELVQRGRQQTEELLSDLDRTLGRGRQQVEVATRRARKATPDKLIRGADRARRTFGVGPAFPILGYDDLTVAQVQNRLPHLTHPDLRRVRDYERRHGNRKSLLAAIEKALA